MEEKIKIELPIILPCAKEREDQCIDRLLEILSYYKGVEKAHIDRQKEGTFLCVHYLPDYFTPEKIQKVIDRAGMKVKNRFKHEILKVKKMDCRTCADVIEQSLSRMTGLLLASVNYQAERIRIDYDSSIISRKQIEERLRLLGYTSVQEELLIPWYRKNSELLLSIISGLFLTLGTFALLFPHSLLPLILFTLSYGAGGYYALRDTIKTILKGRFDIKFLMVIAAIGAAILGKWQEGALLLFLFSLGHALEHHAMARTIENIRALEKITPRTALVRRDGNETTLTIDELLRGDIVVVKPGERIPADGIVVEGHSFVDQSSITGEYIPVEKNPNDSVYAGTLNGNGVIMLSVSKLSNESTIFRVLQIIEEASAQKSISQRFSERFEHIFVPVTIVVVLFMMIIPLILGRNPTETIYKALAILVAASPCALAIATPSAVLAGIARAAKDGVLIKGGIHLENLGKLNSIAFDKTGTITEGTPHLVKIKPLQPFTEEDILKLAASVECNSEHPLANAILQAAKNKNLNICRAEKTESVTGQGIIAYSGGEKVIMGKSTLFSSNSIPLELANEVKQSEASGYTTILIQKESQFMGMLALQDRLRNNAKKLIDVLKNLNIRPTIMITGDNKNSARGIAEITGIDEVFADLLPEEKVRVITECVKKYTYIAMVGDGINDAPAMAHSTVGIAMGSAGSDMALENADVALMADDLMKIPFAISLGRNVNKVIRQNLFIALGVIAILVFSIVAGWVGISVTVIAHEGSTLLVVLNALGILGFKNRYSSETHS